MADGGLISGLVVAIRSGVLGITKVGVCASLLGTDSAGGIVNEKSLEEVETVIAHRSGALTRDDVFISGAAPLGETGLEVGEAGHTGPVLLARSS